MEKGAVPAICFPNACQVMMEKGLSNPAVNAPTVSSSAVHMHGLSTRSHKESDTTE